MNLNKKLLSLAILLIGMIATYLFWDMQSAKPKTNKISGAYKALNLWSAQRAYPNRSIPDVGHFAAFEKARASFRGHTAAVQSVDPWEEIGPHNMGGRTLAIAFNPQNPNTIFAGAASGGLWRSYSGGVGADAWDRVATGFPVLGVSTIAIAPNDSNTIYIGTGEVYNYQFAGTGAAFRSTRGSYGIGILKTTDGGLSWTKSLDWTQNQMRGVWAVRIDPSNSNVVWAATTEGTFKSNDAGASWTQVHNVIMAMDLVIDANNPQNVIVGCGNFSSTGNGIYRTTNGGASWTKITAGVPAAFNGKIQLAIHPTPFGTAVYASFGNGFGFSDGASWLAKSTNSGASWTTVSTLDYSKWQGWYSHAIDINPANQNELMIVGIDVHKSTDAGVTVIQKSGGGPFGGFIPPGDPEGPSNYVHSDVHEVEYHPTNPNIIYIGCDGGVFRSTDGGGTFEGCNGGYQTTQFHNGFSSSTPDSNLAIGGLQDNGTVIYAGTTTWAKWVVGGDGSWTALDPTDRNTIYTSWQGLNVVKSTNGGANFFPLNVPGAGRFTTFIAPFVIGEDEPNVIYAGRDIVYKSSDGGNNWIATNSGNPLDGNAVFAMAVAPQNSNVVYAATAPFVTSPGRTNIFRSVNGGTAWANVTGALPDRFITDIAIDPIDETTLYITLSGFGTSHVYKSDNAGASWQDIGGALPDVPANAVAIDPQFPGHIYIGNDIGVYFSPDGGATWDAYSDGLPDGVIAMSLAISPLNRKLRVATHGNGAYQRDLVTIPTGIDDPVLQPAEFSLAQNFPNPFNPETTIPFALAKSSRVSLKIYNSLGQEVRTLIDNQLKSAGEYQLKWDGRDQSGRKAASGVYLYRLFADGLVTAKRMTLVR